MSILEPYLARLTEGQRKHYERLSQYYDLERAKLALDHYLASPDSRSLATSMQHILTRNQAQDDVNFAAFFKTRFGPAPSDDEIVFD